jgi:polar amino acid transport system substrate-binding protein
MVLVAEDNEDVKDLITSILSEHGYSVIGAVDGAEAIDKFKMNPGISLLILDSVMPKKNGREVYEEIVGIAAGIKVIFTSGYTKDVILDKGIRDREFEFVAKPLKPEILLQKMREVLDR